MLKFGTLCTVAGLRCLAFNLDDMSPGSAAHGAAPSSLSSSSAEFASSDGGGAGGGGGGGLKSLVPELPFGDDPLSSEGKTSSAVGSPLTGVLWKPG
eukprot:scaffold28743_cov43-Phaeocystis_antarctica.AAC.2